jgi:hypothetical protein
MNPRYTGVAVWGRQRRDEVLVDVEDVAAGHRTKLRWNDEDAWVRSAGVAHEPMISPEVFEAARARRAANGRSMIRKPRRTPRPYLLRGLLRCGLCDRRMQASWNHEQAYYRCRYPTEYALPRRAQHPPTVYVREAQIVPPLDDWIARIFEPDRLKETCRALAEAQEAPVVDDDHAVTARQVLVDCDARLARYREALEAGSDPAVVARWISEVQAERRAAEEKLRQRRPAAALTEDDISAMVKSLGDLVGVLGAAEPVKKAALYESLGLALKYEPSKRRVLIEADLGGVRRVRVGGPRRTKSTPLTVRGVVHIPASAAGLRVHSPVRHGGEDVMPGKKAWLLSLQSRFGLHDWHAKNPTERLPDRNLEARNSPMRPGRRRPAAAAPRSR